jgi:hypothetical protein
MVFSKRRRQGKILVPLHFLAELLDFCRFEAIQLRRINITSIVAVQGGCRRRGCYCCRNALSERCNQGKIFVPFHFLAKLLDLLFGKYSASCADHSTDCILRNRSWGGLDDGLELGEEVGHRRWTRRWTITLLLAKSKRRRHSTNVPGHSSRHRHQGAIQPRQDEM